MRIVELARWQWKGYARNHRTRANLWLHLVLVPLFVAGNAVLAGLARMSWTVAAAGIAATLLALALQGRGHAREPNPPEPFTGPANLLARLFLEQWITSPRFVLSGGWYRALRSAP